MSGAITTKSTLLVSVYRSIIHSGRYANWFRLRFGSRMARNLAFSAGLLILPIPGYCAYKMSYYCHLCSAQKSECSKCKMQTINYGLLLPRRNRKEKRKGKNKLPCNFGAFTRSGTAAAGELEELGDIGTEAGCDELSYQAR